MQKGGARACLIAARVHVVFHSKGHAVEHRQGRPRRPARRRRPRGLERLRLVDSHEPRELWQAARAHAVVPLLKREDVLYNVHRRAGALRSRTAA